MTTGRDCIKPNGESKLAHVCRPTVVHGAADAISSEIDCVFVYGTLKTGQCRERDWPHQPKSIQSATTCGELFDLGPYPAMINGNDLIAGELWHFDVAQIPTTLEVLDEIEGFRGRPDDAYHRVAARCETHQGARIAAYAYFYNKDVSAARRVDPGPDGHCRWP